MRQSLPVRKAIHETHESHETPKAATQGLCDPRDEDFVFGRNCVSRLISRRRKSLAMAKSFVRIQDQQSLDRLFAESKIRPILLFKHSNACGISSRAYREMEKLDDVNLLEVQSARELSREVATITGVRHETPQVIVLKDGKAVWNASHYDVNARSVSEALQANS